MADERQPLIDQRTSEEIEERLPIVGGLTPLDIVAPTTALLAWARCRGSGQNPTDTGDSIYLPSLLYALHLLQCQAKDHRGLSVRARIQRVSDSRRALEILERQVDTLLNEQVGDVQAPGGDIGESQDLGQGQSGLDPTQDLQEFESAVWAHWRIGEKDVTVVDLLLPPYADSPSPFLSHPVFVIAIEHTWSHGFWNLSGTQAAGIKRRFEPWITPQRVHSLLLASHAVLLGLAVSLALRPADWIDPYATPRKRINARECTYALWATASFFSALSSIPRTILHLPSISSVILAVLNQPASAFSSLAFSILPLTLLLISPISPSLSFIDKTLIPLSSSLILSTRRAWRSVSLVVGLAIASFVVLSWSMNGDLLRGFDSFAVIATDSSVAHTDHLGRFEGPPEVAPYETRAWVFLTFVILLLLSIVAGSHRLVSPPYRVPFAASGPGSSTLPKSTWEAEYGPVVASKARTVFAETVRDIIRGKPLVAPLNLLLLPFLPVRAVTWLLRASGAHGQALQRWQGTMGAIYDWVFVFITGLLCLPLHLVSRLTHASA